MLNISFLLTTLKDKGFLLPCTCCDKFRTAKGIIDDTNTPGVDIWGVHMHIPADIMFYLLYFKE
jgi:hypothetical protein